METTEKILSRQCAVFKFRDGKVEYFSISTQWGSAETLDKAISNIVEIDKKYEGKSPLSHRISKID